jgi:hypothetical protein
MPGIVIMALVVAGLVAALVLLLFGVALWEKSPIQVYEKIAEDEGPNQKESAAVNNAAARARGFVCCGTFGDKRGGMYKAMQTLWVSPDGAVLVMVAGGTVAGGAQRRVRLLSQSAEAIWQTNNQFGLQDCSGIVSQESVQNGTFEEVHRIHMLRCGPVAATLIPFHRERALEELEALMKRICLAHAARGYMKPVDGQQMVFQHTVRGALHLATVGYFSQLRRASQNRNKAVAEKLAD